MNVLLLLSALLSAITGVNVGSARVPVAAEQVAQVARAAEVAVVAAASVHAPARTFDGITPLRTASPVVTLPVSASPLYASRRRE